MPNFEVKSTVIQVPVEVDTLIDNQFAGKFAAGSIRIMPANGKAQFVLSKSNAQRTAQGQQQAQQKTVDVQVPAEVIAFFESLSAQMETFAVEVFNAQAQSQNPA